jgi:hypothetical protein
MRAAPRHRASAEGQDPQFAAPPAGAGKAGTPEGAAAGATGAEGVSAGTFAFAGAAVSPGRVAALIMAPPGAASAILCPFCQVMAAESPAPMITRSTSKTNEFLFTYQLLIVPGAGS